MTKLTTVFAALATVLVGPATHAAELTEGQARSIVAPFYDALNQPATKDLKSLFDKATSSDWVSCGTNEGCFPRDRVIGAFKKRGEDVPDLTWTIKEVLVSGNRVIVRGEGSGTPKANFLGVNPTGKAFNVMSIDVHTIENDKMVRSYHLEDWAGAVRQLTTQ